MTDLFTALQGHPYMRLTTFRKTGAPVATPVWFAVGEGKIYMYSLSRAGKLKRIRHTPRVRLAPCDGQGKPLGPEFDALASFLPETEVPRVDRLLGRKYGLQLAALKMMYWLRGTQRTFVEIRPTSA